jgi:predicted HAD superfamily phosphohydrolase YqeG
VNPLSARQSPLGTIAQSLPRIRAILGNLRPTWHIRGATDISAATLRADGIELVVWDVDGTLTLFHDRHVAGPFPILSAPGLRHAILSNADERRYEELGEIFPTIPVCKGYRIDGALRLRVLHAGKDSFDAATRRRIGEPTVVPVRKPDGPLLLEVARVCATDPSAVVMVGDQYFTDIAGANLAGVRSIKVDAIGWERLPWGIRFGQRVEQLCYRLLHGAPRWVRPTGGA